jgi:hypothetical protein
MKRLVIFTNTPYVKLPKNNDSLAYRKYKNNDVTALFYYRIIKELKPILLCGFNKLDLLQAPVHEKFRAETKFCDKIIKQFICPSKSWGLNGDFPIGFNICLL